MDINITLAVFVIGFILVLGEVFSVTFHKTRVPDILPLMILGFLLGPVLKLVTPDTFGQMGDIFTEMVLILVMFKTGFEFRFSYLRDSFLPGLIFCVVYMIAVVSVSTLAAVQFLKLPFIYALAVGFVLSDNSLVIVVPLLAKFNITQNLRTILTVETTMGKIINVIVVFALLGMAQQKGGAEPAMVFGQILYTFLAAALVGLVSGIFWTAILSRVRQFDNGMTLTFAFILMVYSVSAVVGSKGAVGVLMLGLVMGNIRVLHHLWGKKMEINTVSMKGQEKDFFIEIEFAFKTLFFVFMGTTLYLKDIYYITCGVILAALKFLVRVPVVNFALSKKVDRRDCAVAFAMVPNGLVSAVLCAVVVRQYGAAGGIADVVYSVIFFTVIMSSALSFIIEKGWFTKTADRFFARHVPYVPKTENPLPAQTAAESDFVNE
ncbi:MAG: cation:proton antiporter [Elusimicrobium sp.]|jgi:NhaP-type Na+/H+ or K+/H+ antiporter|nr:cation:proton antiporter [Elusimicrobium sp.]